MTELLNQATTTVRRQKVHLKGHIYKKERYTLWVAPSLTVACVYRNSEGILLSVQIASSTTSGVRCRATRFAVPEVGFGGSGGCQGSTRIGIVPVGTLAGRKGIKKPKWKTKSQRWDFFLANQEICDVYFSSVFNFVLLGFSVPSLSAGALEKRLQRVVWWFFFFRALWWLVVRLFFVCFFHGN